MGGINQSHQSLQYTKTTKRTDSKNELLNKNIRKSQHFNQNIEPDLKTIIFSTLFPQPHNASIEIVYQHPKKSFNCPRIPLLQNDLSIYSFNSFYSYKDDNQSFQSDYPNIDEDPLMSNSNALFQEKAALKGKRLRMDYYAKLVQKNIWLPMTQLRNHNTLFFFDWDDTLMCTSFLTPSGQYTDDIKLSDKDKEKLRNLDTTVANIMQRTSSLGDVYIITNAAPGWVEYSAKKFYPLTSKQLTKINVISARGIFEKKYPGDNKQWKVMAFLDVLNTLNTKLITNLICLGDSIIEIEAAHILASKFAHAYIKTIKFKENPIPLELHKQLSLVENKLISIYSCVKNLTMRVEKKKTD